MLFPRAIIVSIVSLASTFAALAPSVVSFDQLAKHPQRYNGKFVSVAAWLQVDDTHKVASLAPRPHADASGLPEIFVDWPRPHSRTPCICRRRSSRTHHRHFSVSKI